MGARLVRLVLALMVAAMLAAACGDDAVDTTDDAGGGEAAEEVPEETSSGLTVKAVNFAFDPRELEVEAGQEVEITFTNSDTAPHTFTSEDLGVDVRLDPGSSETFTATAPDSGEVEWHCEIHPQMTGTLKIAGATGAGAGAKSSDAGDGADGGYDY